MSMNMMVHSSWMDPNQYPWLGCGKSFGISDFDISAKFRRNFLEILHLAERPKWRFSEIDRISPKRRNRPEQPLYFINWTLFDSYMPPNNVVCRPNRWNLSISRRREGMDSGKWMLEKLYKKRASRLIFCAAVSNNDTMKNNLSLGAIIYRRKAIKMRIMHTIPRTHRLR